MYVVCQFICLCVVFACATYIQINTSLYEQLKMYLYLDFMKNLFQACWVLKHFCELKFKQEANLMTALERVRTALCTDKELPVRVEAAIALQVLLVEQEKGMASLCLLMIEKEKKSI